MLRAEQACVHANIVFVFDCIVLAVAWTRSCESTYTVRNGVKSKKLESPIYRSEMTAIELVCVRNFLICVR